MPRGSAVAVPVVESVSTATAITVVMERNAQIDTFMAFTRLESADLPLWCISQ